MILVKVLDFGVEPGLKVQDCSAVPAHGVRWMFEATRRRRTDSIEVETII